MVNSVMTVSRASYNVFTCFNILGTALVRIMRSYMKEKERLRSRKLRLTTLRDPPR
jgi:hypothetical protein